ncbi:MAG TPA: YggS family pyridoxal phosphate-dependent enzyme [Ilumatobacteraceae bacterium]
MTQFGDIAERLQRVRQQIVDAGGTDVEVLAVTKGHGIAAIQAAAAAGLTRIGENYAQELVGKVEGAVLDVNVHFIGQLQTNKVRLVAEIVDVYETVDRPALITEIAKRAPAAHVLIQVDTTGEPGKGGCPPAEVEALVGRASGAGLAVDGLMTVGPTEGGAEAGRKGFREVRRLCDELGLATCSMGMTDDFIVAVQEGSTRVRLGSALFGMRPARTAQVR